MAVRDRNADSSRDDLAALGDELQRRIDALESEVAALQNERDQVRAGFEVLSRALRRRGCCDSSNGSTPQA